VAEHHFAFLPAEGGHIGYAVLPDFRRRGHATETLRQSVVVARGPRIGWLLLACGEHSVASMKIIERCGGRRDPQRPTTPGPHPIRRYWTD
jgi:predicted acetyltransferase